MVIYGNNLHEKLQGLAISREYLKYNTPFCDIVDAPEWQTDINLALDYNCAINGNLECATKVVQSLTLNSSVLDNSTIEWYLHKIKYNPVFNTAIRDMRARWSNLDGFDDDFQKLLLQGLKDCLNSPCNLFTETSDSIARMAQSASTRNSDNSFEFDFADGNFMTNMVDGLDETITNKIPNIFSDAFTEVVGLANKAFKNTQEVLAGKKNLADLRSRVQSGKSFRDPAKVFRYSPDVKSYYDYSAASSNVLAKIKEDLGGCFNRFEFKYRYNPYNNNMSTPISKEVVGHVNGVDFDKDPTGTANRYRNNRGDLAKQTETTSTSTPSNTNPGLLSVSESIITEDVQISPIFRLQSKLGNNNSYSIFSSLIDEEDKTLYYEDYAVKPDDKNTLKGLANIGRSYRIGISHIGTDNDFIKRALNGEDVTQRELQVYGESTQPGNYAFGFRHNLTDEGMETLYNTPKTKIINDGVAVSKGLFGAFIGDPKFEFTKEKTGSYKKPQEANRFFVAARPAGATNWKFFKVIDSNTGDHYNVDFTVGAYKHFLKSYGLGELDKGKKEKEIAGTEWTRVLKNFQKDIGTMEVRLCFGNIDDLITTFNTTQEDGSEIDPFSQAAIDAGSLEDVNFALNVSEVEETSLAGNTILPQLDFEIDEEDIIVPGPAPEDLPPSPFD